MPGGIAGGSIGIAIITRVAMFLGVDPRVILQGTGGLEPPAGDTTAPADPVEERLKDFVSAVLADTEYTRAELFGRGGPGTYRRPSSCPVHRRRAVRLRDGAVGRRPGAVRGGTRAD